MVVSVEEKAWSNIGNDKKITFYALVQNVRYYSDVVTFSGFILTSE